MIQLLNSLTYYLCLCCISQMYFRTNVFKNIMHTFGRLNLFAAFVTESGLNYTINLPVWTRYKIIRNISESILLFQTSYVNGRRVDHVGRFSKDLIQIHIYRKNSTLNGHVSHICATSLGQRSSPVKQLSAYLPSTQKILYRYIVRFLRQIRWTTHTITSSQHVADHMSPNDYHDRRWWSRKFYHIRVQLVMSTNFSVKVSSSWNQSSQWHINWSPSTRRHLFQ